ncbi:hypothetical protein Tco_0179283 [Tanacetum coccineum]
MKRVNTFTLMKSDDTVPKVIAGSSKRDADQELNRRNLMIIVPEEGMNVEALQTKYPIIDWEVYTEDSRMYWKIIRVDYPNEQSDLRLDSGVIRLQLDEYSVMADELLRKIFILVNRPRQ